MSGHLAFTPREVEVVTLLAQGLTVSGVDERLGTTMSSRHVAGAKAKACVTTVRALVYVSLADGRIARPTPLTNQDQLSELEQMIWAALRFDVLDSQLPGAVSRLARTTGFQVKEVLAGLKERYRTTYCGLIARGFALGLLSGREGIHLPVRAVTAAAGMRPPGPSRSGPWKLTGRQDVALGLLPLTRNSEEAAAQMAVSASTYRQHLKAICEVVGVSCLRALTHRALQDGILRPPPPEHALPGVVPAVATVWRGLVLDVPDADLQAEIAAASGLSGATVHAALRELRAGGEADWQLVVRGWATRVITPQDGTDRLARPRVPAAARGPRPTGRGHGSHRPPLVDRLHLLPATATTYRPQARRGTGAAGLVQDAGIGRSVDLVRVTPDVCRTVLAGLPPAQWGPVIGCVEAETALLLTAPAQLPQGWRARHGRLWSRAGTVTLPPEDRPAPDGSYWAVSRHAPLWDPARLEELLNHLPPALAAAQHG